MKRNVLFAAAFTLLIASAALAEDKNVLIDFHFTATSPDFSAFVGSYTISGAINESGLAESTAGTRLNDEGVLLLYANKTLHLQGGDIYLFIEGPLTVNPDGTMSMTGKWRLTGGTGAYTDIKGHGTAAVVGDMKAGTVHGVYQGKVNVK